MSNRHNSTTPESLATTTYRRPWGLGPATPCFEHGTRSDLLGSARLDGHPWRMRVWSPRIARADGRSSGVVLCYGSGDSAGHSYLLSGCGPELTCGASLSHSLDITQNKQKSPWS